jgi:hypothetical protein
MEQMMPEYLEKILEAKNAGTCENKEVWGMKVEDCHTVYGCIGNSHTLTSYLVINEKSLVGALRQR